MLAQPNSIHYMAIIHDKNNRVLQQHWHFYVFKNGTFMTSIPVTVRYWQKAGDRNDRSAHVMSFKNDGTPDSNWTLIAVDTSSPYNFYQQSWTVVANVDTNKNVKYLRSRLDSDGGYTGRDKA